MNISDCLKYFIYTLLEHLVMLGNPTLRNKLRLYGTNPLLDWLYVE